MNFWIHKMNTQSLPQFEHMEDATAALALSGIVFQGSVLRLSRPTSYVVIEPVRFYSFHPSN